MDDPKLPSQIAKALAITAQLSPAQQELLDLTNKVSRAVASSGQAADQKLVYVLLIMLANLKEIAKLPIDPTPDTHAVAKYFRELREIFFPSEALH